MHVTMTGLVHGIVDATEHSPSPAQSVFALVRRRDGTPVVMVDSVIESNNERDLGDRVMVWLSDIATAEPTSPLNHSTSWQVAVLLDDDKMCRDGEYKDQVVLRPELIRRMADMNVTLSVSSRI